ncbi:hypothetical protein F5146DRAFT_1024016 [Armillaria mellea]|nr:hypothetical protein F5146DRAFT_1024016 [Armillaria mellea]
MAVENSADDTDVQALAWLIHMSSNPSVRNIVLESTSALSLKSVKSLEQRIPRISFECSTALETLGSSQDVSVHENKVDRLLRAHLRFTDAFYVKRMPRPVKGCLSPGIYADLLSIQTDYRKEIRELVISNLRAVPDDPTVLRLQPIVWAYLLQKLLPSGPDNLEVMQLLFTEIPSFYWRADYISPIHFMERKGMKIPYEDGVATTLQMAIQGGLYLYVAEVILQDHVGVESTVFRQDYDLSPPQDSRLYLLLNMAGSHSIRSMAIPPYSFSDSLFSRILRGIGEFLGVNVYDNNLPAVALDTNRYAVLKLLYDLISSAEFDDTVTHRDQIFVLTTFFRVLNSTLPHPPFLAKDWCTPQLAIKSVQIAFEEASRPSLYHEDYYHTAHELGTYFFRHTSFTNEALAHFVSTLFEHLRKQDGRVLSVFLDLIVTGLASEQLDVQVRQQSLEYLYKPENLFASCTTLITCGETRTLRRLALLHPKDPAWSGCLRQLEVFDFPEQASVMHYIRHTISNFKAFIEAGCVGTFGKADTMSSNFMRLDQEDEDSPRHYWSTVWHRVRRFIPGKDSREETGLSNNDSGV